jgi:hypothetical protein
MQTLHDFRRMAMIYLCEVQGKTLFPGCVIFVLVLHFESEILDSEGLYMPFCDLL